MTINSKSFATAISCVVLAAPGFAINLDKPTATTQAVVPPALPAMDEATAPDRAAALGVTASPSRLAKMPALTVKPSGGVPSQPASIGAPAADAAMTATPALVLAPIEPIAAPTLQEHVRAIILPQQADEQTASLTAVTSLDELQPAAMIEQLMPDTVDPDAGLSAAYLPTALTEEFAEAANLAEPAEAPVALAAAVDKVVPFVPETIVTPETSADPVAAEATPVVAANEAPTAAPVAEQPASAPAIVVPAISEAPARPPVVEAPVAVTAMSETAPAPVPAPAPAQADMSQVPVTSGAIDLKQAIAIGIDSNPEINQAIMNKEAIEFERKQAQGLYAPRVNIEASAGVRRLENNTRRTLNIADQELYPIEGQVNAEWTVVDFGRRRGELTRQASRVDGAALRVLERSEFIGLQIARQYLDILLQQRIVAASQDNVTFHRNLVNDLGQGVTQGSISIADQQQAQERMQAAVVRQVEAEEALENAKITLRTLTGLDIHEVNLPPSLRNAMPPTINETVGLARTHNPRVKEAGADVDAATALVNKHRGDLYPTIGLDGRARAGDDIDGFRGSTNDLQARVVMRWNIFDGGINRAKLQEMVRRASEARFRLHEVSRAAEEDARRAWNSWTTQGKLTNELSTEAQVSDDLLLSYRSQFNVGRRSLLDVLDAQNTRYNVQVRLETARFSQQFAEYQVLAATNQFLTAIGAVAPPAATSNERGRFNYGPPAPAELQRRVKPN